MYLLKIVSSLHLSNVGSSTLINHQISSHYQFIVNFSKTNLVFISLLYKYWNIFIFLSFLEWKLLLLFYVYQVIKINFKLSIKTNLRFIKSRGPKWDFNLILLLFFLIFHQLQKFYRISISHPNIIFKRSKSYFTTLCNRGVAQNEFESWTNYLYG